LNESKKKRRERQYINHQQPNASASNRSCLHTSDVIRPSFPLPRSSVHHRATASCHQPHLPPQAATPPSLTLQRIHALRHRNTHPSIAPPSPHVYPRPSNPHRQNGCYVHYRRPPGRIARRTSARSPSCCGGKVRITVLEVPRRSYGACVEALAGKLPIRGVDSQAMRSSCGRQTSRTFVASSIALRACPQQSQLAILSCKQARSAHANLSSLLARDRHPRHHLHDRCFLHGRRRQGRQVASPNQRQEQG
jgi:hypothetical protein